MEFKSDIQATYASAPPTWSIETNSLGTVSTTATIIPVVSTTDFPNAGKIIVQGMGERVRYSSKISYLNYAATIGPITDLDTVIPINQTAAYNSQTIIKIDNELMNFVSSSGSTVLGYWTLNGDLADTDNVVLVKDNPTSLFPTQSGLIGIDGTEYVSYASITPNTGTNQLDGSIDDTVTTITVDSTSSFASSGFILIESEIIKYTGKTETDFTGCIRGSRGSTNDSHADNTIVTQIGSLNGCVRGLYGSSAANWTNGDSIDYLPTLTVVRGAYSTTPASYVNSTDVDVCASFNNCTRGVNNTTPTQINPNTQINNDIWTIEAPVRLKAISISSNGSGEGFLSLSTGSSWDLDDSVFLKINVKNNKLYTLNLPNDGIIFPKGIYLYDWNNIYSITLYTDKYSKPGLTAGN
jgi:hypothetical protein